MFAVIKVLNNKKSFFSRVKSVFCPVKPELYRIDVRNAAPFYYLEIEEKQCGEGFENVADILGNCAKKLIVCDDYSLPTSKLVDYFRPTRLPSIALLNSAIDLIEKTPKDKSHFSIAIIDEMAFFREYVSSFINCASIINVLTEYPEKYEDIARILLDEWGVSLVITPSYTMIEDCDVIVCPTHNKFRQYSKSIVFNHKSGRKIYKGDTIEIPEEYKKLKPEGVDDLLFASALYELCGVDSMKTIKYSKFKEE